jgi:sensor domain CHASE-containing protein
MENHIKSGGNILASIIPLAILFVLVQAASLIAFFHFSFHAVEEYAIKKNLQSCIGTMQTELDRIGGVVLEWSAWDDTARFVKGQDPDFIQANMAENTLQKQNLNVLCILDSQGKPVWTRCVKTQDDKPQPVNLSLFSLEVLKKNDALWNHKSPDNCVAGYCSTEGGVLMLSSRPVTGNSGTSPVCGTVIMGRFISDEFMASVAKQDCRDFQWWNLRTDYTRDALRQYLSRITPENPIYIESNPRTSTAYTVLPDINGKDAILMKFATANDIARFKQGWLVKCLGLYLIEGLIFIAYLAAFTNRHCTTCSTQKTQNENFTAENQYVSFQQITETQHSKNELLV